VSGPNKKRSSEFGSVRPRPRVWPCFFFCYKRQMTCLPYLLFFNNKIRADDASSAIQDSGHKWMAENQVKMFLVSRFHFLSCLKIKVLLNIVEHFLQINDKKID